jgi:hypothetical protein
MRTEHLFYCPYCEFNHRDLPTRNLHIIKSHREMIHTDYDGSNWHYWTPIKELERSYVYE